MTRGTAGKSARRRARAAATIGVVSATALLRSNRPLRALFGARLLSYAGDSMSLVALMLHVAATTGEGLAVALLLLVGDVAPALLGPLTGAVSDRFDRRRVMIACELVQAGLVGLVALGLAALSLPALLVLVALRSVAAQVFQPASRAAVPALVDDGDLETANSTIGFGANAAEAFGPLLAAALLPAVGTRGVLATDAATFLVSALMLLRLRPLPPVSSSDGDGSSMLAAARIGLGFILRVPAVRVVAIGFCGVVAFNGVDDVALVLLATEELRSGEASVGLLLGAVGVGLVAGYAVLTRCGARWSMPVVLVAGFVVSSAGNVATGLAWSVVTAFSWQLVRGLGIAGMDVASSTLLQRTVPPAMLGRVFGNVYGAVGVAAALSYVGGGLLLDATDTRTTLVVAGTGGLLVTLAVALTLARALRRHRQLDSMM